MWVCCNHCVHCVNCTIAACVVVLVFVLINGTACIFAACVWYRLHSDTCYVVCRVVCSKAEVEAESVAAMRLTATRTTLTRRVHTSPTRLYCLRLDASIICVRFYSLHVCHQIVLVPSFRQPALCVPDRLCWCCFICRICYLDAMYFSTVEQTD